jgi:hypothetical protein
MLRDSALVCARMRAITFLFGTLVFVTSGLAQSPGAQTTQGSSRYQPITAEGRLRWVSASTLDPPALVGGVFSAGWGTLLNVPNEYGPRWEGFGKRYGMRLTGLSVSNAMEAGFGALWGEAPRYVRVGQGQPLK